MIVPSLATAGLMIASPVPPVLRIVPVLWINGAAALESATDRSDLKSYVPAFSSSRPARKLVGPSCASVAPAATVVVPGSVIVPPVHVKVPLPIVKLPGAAERPARHRIRSGRGQACARRHVHGSAGNRDGAEQARSRQRVRAAAELDRPGRGGRAEATGARAGARAQGQLACVRAHRAVVVERGVDRRRDRSARLADRACVVEGRRRRPSGSSGRSDMKSYVPAFSSMRPFESETNPSCASVAPAATVVVPASDIVPPVQVKVPLAIVKPPVPLTVPADIAFGPEATHSPPQAPSPSRRRSARSRAASRPRACTSRRRA